MTTVVLTLLSVGIVAAWVTIRGLRCAEDGFEDGSGFHFTDPHRDHGASSGEDVPLLSRHFPTPHGH